MRVQALSQHLTAEHLTKRTFSSRVKIIIFYMEYLTSVLKKIKRMKRPTNFSHENFEKHEGPPSWKCSSLHPHNKDMINVTGSVLHHGEQQRRAVQGAEWRRRDESCRLPPPQPIPVQVELIRTRRRVRPSCTRKLLLDEHVHLERVVEAVFLEHTLDED